MRQFWMMWVAAGAAGAVMPAAAQVKKPLVSVNGIEDMAKTSQGDAFAKMIETAVTNTGKFRVFEDNHVVLLAQQAKAAAGIITSRTPGKRGGFTGADFLIYGTITTASSRSRSDFGGSAKSGIIKDFGSILGRKTGLGNLGESVGGRGGQCAKSVTSLAIDVKIVDGESGEVRYATSLNPKAESESSCTGDVTIDQGMLLRTAATQIAGYLVTSIYPVKVAAIQADGTLMLNYGVGAVTLNSVMTVFGPGERIVDPDNGAVLSEGEGTALGNIRIVDVQAKISKAVPVGRFVSPPERGFIVRPAVAALNKAARDHD